MNKESTPDETIKHKWNIEELKKIAARINKYERVEFEREEKHKIDRDEFKSQTCPC